MACTKFVLAIIFIFHVLSIDAMSHGLKFNNSRSPRTMNVVFYVHAKVTTPNATAVRVAGPNGDTTSTQFGTIFVIDDVLTQGQSNNSKVVGRGKGIVLVASLNLSHAFYVWSAVLETPRYNGTIAFQGTDKAVRNGEMEHAIVGGTGDFRFVSGYANFTHVELLLPDSVIFVNATIFRPPHSIF